MTRNGRARAPGDIVALHRTRRSALEKEAAWILDSEGVERSAAGEGARRVSYTDIAEIGLSYDPTRFETDRYRCDLVTKSRARELIVSVSYVSLGNFENRAATYVPFVRALALNTMKANRGCRFIAGKKPFVYFAEHGFLLAMLLLLVSVLYFTGVPVAGVVAIKLGLVAVYVPIMLRYTNVNRPRRFDPENIPADVLPAS